MGMKYLLSKKWFLLFETAYLIVIPIYLLSFLSSIWVILGSLLYVGSFIVALRLNVTDLGLTKNKFIPAVQKILTISIISAVLLISLGLFGIQLGMFSRIIEGLVGNGKVNGLLFYSLISAPLQEIIFRGYYIKRLEYVSKNEWFLKLWSAGLFAAVHIPFGNVYLVVVCFLFGIWAAGIFIKYRNLYAIMIAHALIGGAEIIRQILIMK